jgi:hypothetical protein
LDECVSLALLLPENEAGTPVSLWEIGPNKYRLRRGAECNIANWVWDNFTA